MSLPVRTAVTLGLVAALSLAASGCGGGGGGTPTPVPSPRTTTTLLTQRYTVNADTTVLVGFTDVQLPGAGDVVVTFDWTLAESDFDLLATTSICHDFPGAWAGTAPECLITAADKGPGKPARLAFAASSGGVVRIVLYKWSRLAESGVMTISITR